MPRYFFHVLNGKAVVDEIGFDLTNSDKMRTEAIRAAGQMLSDGKHSWNGQAWQTVVTMSPEPSFSA
ncbi:DUF6894 family protein [Rhizobium sp. ZW T2_16]|jgi:hypothetical protein|uniref:DUF6894 family protein n=1 Tax=Rhizobium sp. ZW T2_16 TaxID=3378083 RepID=UPI000FA0F474